MLDRRTFLKAGGMAIATASAAPSLVAASTNASRHKVLVTIFQRGAMDGLMAVSPLDVPALRQLRPRLSREKLLELGGGYGLHPAFAELLPYWQEGRLAIVHGVGSPVLRHGHFEAQDDLESGTPGQPGTPDGWLNRLVGQLPGEPSSWRAVAMSSALPRSLRGAQPAQALHQALEKLGRLAPPTAEARYPSSSLGQALQQVAALIKADVGLQVAVAESDGWDTHVHQAATFARPARDLAASVAAFDRDLGPLRDDVLVVTLTEFGRTVAENAAAGTEHGRASCMFVLGAGIAGGKVHGAFPGLDPALLATGKSLSSCHDQCLEVTTDYRAALAGLAAGHFGLRDPSPLFPGFAGQPLALA